MKMAKKSKIKQQVTKQNSNVPLMMFGIIFCTLTLIAVFFFLTGNQKPQLSGTLVTRSLNGGYKVSVDKNHDAILRSVGLDPEKSFWQPIEADLEYLGITSGEMEYRLINDCGLQKDSIEIDTSHYVFGQFVNPPGKWINVNLCRPQQIIDTGFPLNNDTVGQTVAHETLHSLSIVFPITSLSVQNADGTTTTLTSRQGFFLNGDKGSFGGLEELAVHSCVNTVVSEGGMPGFNPRNAAQEYQDFFKYIFGENLSSACREVFNWRKESDGLQKFCAAILMHSTVPCNKGELIAADFLTNETPWIERAVDVKEQMLSMNAADYNKRKFGGDTTPLSWDLK